MSILLDALKKSEEQRHLGKTPDIHDTADHKPAGEKMSIQRWLPVVMIIAAVSAMSWFGWKQYREPEMETVSGTPAVSQRQQAEVPGAGDEPVPVKTDRTPVESFTAPEEETALVDSSAGKQAEQRGQELARSVSQFEKPAEKNDEPEPSAAAQVELPTPAPVKRQSIQSTAIQPHVSAPISYWELPQNVRDSLPEFNITVMVYAEEPKNRFLLVNGQRMVEKEVLDGVELEEIQRDGAVFRYRNYRFLVKG